MPLVSSFTGTFLRGFPAVAAASSGFVSNFSDDNIFYSAGSINNLPTGLDIKPDGTKLYMSGTNSGTGPWIDEFTLSAPFDLSSAVHNSGARLDTTGAITNPYKILFKPDGTVLFVAGNGADIIEYAIGTPWDLSTAALTTTHSNVLQGLGSQYGLAWNDTGTKLFSHRGGVVYEYNIAAPYNIGTLTYSNISYTTGISDTRDIDFTEDGLTLIVSSRGTDSFHEFNLTSAFDLSTIANNNRSYLVSTLTGTTNIQPTGFVLGNTDQKVYWINQGNDTIRQFSTGYTPGGGGGASWYGDRAVVNNGIVGGSYSNTIEYFDITTLGNSSSFGTSTVTGAHWGSVSDTTYAVSARGLNQSTIEYVTIATTGNASSFGTMLATSFRRAGASDGSRGLFAPQGVDIEYITIATPSNATDFGDLNFTNGSSAGGSDGTYALWGGTSSNGNNIDYVTIQTPGNAIDFGDLTIGRAAGAAASDDTRTIFTGGVDGINNDPTVDYVTTATPGNATDFGDLLALQYNHAATGNSTRAVAIGGENGGSNVIQYMTYQTPGNAIDFGDLAGNTSANGATSGSP